jgi:hypothetical protein
VPIAAVPRSPAARPSEPAAGTNQPALLPGGFLPLRPARLAFSLGSGMAWLDKQTAAANQIGDSGVTFNGALGLTLYDIVMVSATFSFPLLSDNASFSQDVVPETGGGDPQSAHSSLNVGTYSIAIGLRTPFWAIGAMEHGWATGALFAQVGTAGVGASRTIENCSDCRDDHIEIPGGTFWRVGLDLLLPSRKPTVFYGLTVSYERYAAGAGLSDEVRIGLSYFM